jgi:hypothetical protein
MVDASIMFVTLGDSVVYTDKAYSALTRSYDNEPKEVLHVYKGVK